MDIRPLTVQGPDAEVYQREKDEVSKQTLFRGQSRLLPQRQSLVRSAVSAKYPHVVDADADVSTLVHGSASIHPVPPVT